ncbi:MAG: hypothetical protein E7096_08215 [Bacteroides sp.]|nr:hypothetical protein [Bacteroides sp.]
MKKIRLVLWAAALMSAFSFTSCLDENNDPIEYMSLVTIDSSMGMSVMYPDENPEQQFIFAGDLTQYGITAGATRALITYTVPEVIDWMAPQVQITLVSGRCQNWPVEKVTDINYVDTCATYTSPITAFSNYGIGSILFPSLNVVRGRFLNVGYNYRANKVGQVAMTPNRVSNDTVYFDLKLKKEGYNLSSGAVMNSFDLNSAYRFMSGAVSKDDSLHVTVIALTSEDLEGKQVKKDSVTTRFKNIY